MAGQTYDHAQLAAGLDALHAAVTVPSLPLHAAPDIRQMPKHVARQLLAAEMAQAGDLGLYAGALPSILAERLLAPEIHALAAVLRALAAYQPEHVEHERDGSCCGLPAGDL